MNQAFTKGGTLLNLFQVFFFLQLLDFLTTILAIQLGGRELNPIVRMFMHFGVLTGLVIGKAAVVGIGAFVVWVQRRRVLLIANYVYASLIVWNLIILIALKNTTT